MMPAGSTGHVTYQRRVARPAPADQLSVVQWLRAHLFNSVLNSVLTVLAVAAIVLALPLLNWAIVDAVWQAPDPEECRLASGACWAVVAEKHRVMLFGFYPYDEHWRPALALLIYAGAIGLSARQRFWSWRVLAPLWLAAAAVVVVLLLGGVFGLSRVNTRQWGGVPLTMVVFTWTVATALPLGILLALGRRSKLPVVRMTSTAFIETVRGVPLVTVLFSAAMIFPLFTPPGWTFDVLVRVLIGISLYYAAYFAEVVRGGLQAISKEQHEAADSLGLSYWQKMRLVILPQALRIAIPGIMNYVVIAFKNSTYVVVVGLFDLLNATRAALSDPLWMRYHVEAYLFVALMYFLGAYALSLLGQHVERSTGQGRT